MTMLDDDRLASLLARAGDAFEVPAAGPADILARAAGRWAGQPVTTRRGARDRRRRATPTGTLRRTAPERGGCAASAGVARPAPRALCGRLHRRRRSCSPAPSARSVGSPSRAPTLHLGRCPRRRWLAARATTTTVPRFSATRARRTSRCAAAVAHGAAGPAGPTAPDARPRPHAAPTLPSGAVGQSAKIEQTGSLGLTVGRGDLSRTVTQLTDLAGAYGGFVANSQTQSGAGDAAARPRAASRCRCRWTTSPTVLKRAEGLGKTSDLTTKATDVTGQYVDLQSRITALEASRQQYLTILAKATTVGDVLAVQEQLDTIQDQIEQLQGQLQLLTSETSYSTLTVSVSEGQPAPPPEPAARVRAGPGLARQRRRLRRRRRGRDQGGRAAALRSLLPRRRRVRRPRPVAPLPAPPPVARPGVRGRSAAAMGCPASSPRRCRRTGPRPR